MSDLGPASYLDTSALVKLVRPEPESAAMIDFVRGSELHPTSIELVEVELMRAIRRDSRDDSQRALVLLEELIVLPLTGSIKDRAIAIDPASVRSLDAIHVAAAVEIQAHLGTFVTYDKRMAEAASGCGLPVLSPGI